MRTSGATSSAYTLQHRCRGHGTRGGHSDQRERIQPRDGQTATVASPQAPSNRAAPAISGQAVEGQTLNATNGSWNATIRCVLRLPVGGLREFLFEHLGGDELLSYMLQASDVAQKIDVVVTATNAGGTDIFFFFFFFFFFF